MKKILLIAALFVGTLSAFAQTEKGTWMVGADVAGLDYGLDSEVFDVHLTPSVAYFVSNNWAVGGVASLGIVAPSEGDATTSWAIGPMARGYFGKSEKSKLFGQVDFVFGGIDQGDPTTFWNVGVGVGNAWFLTKNVALQLGLRYDYNQVEDQDGTSGIGLNLGFQIHLPGKKK